MPTILITNRIPDSQLAPLDGVGELIHGPGPYELMPRGEVLRHASRLDAIICQGELKIDTELLDAAPRLKIVANVAIGYDNLDVPLMASRGVWATNAPDSFTESAADAALALLLAVARRIVEGDSFIRAGQWKRFQPGRWNGALLHGRTLGIVGFGKIGQAVARRARAFGMKVIYHQRTRLKLTRDVSPQKDSPQADDGYRTLNALLAEADVVCLCVPLTPQTTRLIDAKRLTLMKPGAMLVNVARGKVVDEAALVEALRSGKLAGAGLDVFEREPVVHPALIGMKNVVLTPHLGGGTHEARGAAQELAASNVAAVLRGERPMTPLSDVKAR